MLILAQSCIENTPQFMWIVSLPILLPSGSRVRGGVRGRVRSGVRTSSYFPQLFWYCVAIILLLSELCTIVMMAEVLSRDPGGNPTSSPQNVMLFPGWELLPTLKFRPHTRGYKRIRNSLNSATAINRRLDIQFTSGNGENNVRLKDLAGLIADLKNIIVK